MREDLNKEGYSKEEEYFNKLNRELIQKLKKKDAAEKPDETEKAESPGKDQP